MHRKKYYIYAYYIYIQYYKNCVYIYIYIHINIPIYQYICIFNSICSFRHPLEVKELTPIHREKGDDCSGDFLRLNWEALKYPLLCYKTVLYTPSQSDLIEWNDVETFSRQRLFLHIFSKQT